MRYGAPARRRPWKTSARVVVVSVMLGTGVLMAASIPQYDAVKHLGVGSCASTQCHGAVKVYAEGNIRRTEYRQWSQNDKHARAYEVLRSKESRAIAAKLGLANAHDAQICLDCHADNVPTGRRGAKFQISDGIGCEACHGGAERWIKSHTEDNITHEKNLAAGMYPTETPAARARLCLSCHYGDERKFATHRIMAAGHPRLSFELDTFTVLQQHYEIDDDYRNRKRFVDSPGTWATGIVTAAGESLRMLRDPEQWGKGLFPEIALFDCHACHHAMKDRRWATRATTAGLPPGALRLNDSSLVMLYAVVLTTSSGDAERLLTATRSLHAATLTSREAVTARSRELDTLVQGIGQKIRSFRFDRPAIAATRKTILDLGTRGEFRDYTGAEQAVMAIDLLSYSLGQDKSLRQDIDRLFTLLKDDARFSPADFAAALGQFRQKAGAIKS